MARRRGFARSPKESGLRSADLGPPPTSLFAVSRPRQLRRAGALVSPPAARSAAPLKSSRSFRDRHATPSSAVTLSPDLGVAGGQRNDRTLDGQRVVRVLGGQLRKPDGNDGRFPFCDDSCRGRARGCGFGRPTHAVFSAHPPRSAWHLVWSTPPALVRGHLRDNAEASPVGVRQLPSHCIKRA